MTVGSDQPTAPEIISRPRRLRQARPPRRSQRPSNDLTRSPAIRLFALLLAFAISGGLLIFPRDPVVVVLIFTCVAILGWRFPIYATRAPIYIFMAVFVVVSALQPGGLQIASTISRLLQFIAALLLLEVYVAAPANAIQNDLFLVLRLMAIQAIITWIIGNTVPQVFWTVNISGSNYQTFLYVFNYHHVALASERLVRPDGFFYEPGVFQIYLNIFLYLCLFIYRKLIWILIAAASVLATWSTIGLAISLIMMAVAAITFLRGRRANLAAFALFGAVLVPVVLFLAVQNFDQKVSGARRSSFYARYYDYRTGMNIISEYPMTGIGFGRDKYLTLNKSLGYRKSELSLEQATGRLNTNGLLQALYTLGIPIGSVIILGLVFQKLFPSRVIFPILLLLSLYAQSLIFTPFFSMIAFSGLLYAGWASTSVSRQSKKATLPRHRVRPRRV